jgi:hypothetical protein
MQRQGSVITIHQELLDFLLSLSSAYGSVWRSIMLHAQWLSMLVLVPLTVRAMQFSV